MSSDPKISRRSEQESGTDDVRERRSRHAFRQFSPSVSLLVITSMVMLAILLASVVTGHRTRLRDTALAQNPPNPAWTRSVSVFTPARASLADAFKEFVGWQSTPVQPIAFNHKVHLQNNIDCANCHEGVTQGPNAGIPSVSFCMACHQAIAVDKPEIKKLTAYANKGQDVPWQRVYWFYPETHVRFWHSPHINAGVDCKQCHGDVSQQTVAVRSTDMTMNFCLTCHRVKGVSVDCSTCHY